jgi:tryptophan synthase alpha subunit
MHSKIYYIVYHNVVLSYREQKFYNRCKNIQDLAQIRTELKITNQD